MTNIDPLSGASAALTHNIAPERVHRPGTPGFDDCTRLWNGAVTRRPALVVQPTSQAEVGAMVRYARDRGMPIAVRGGGHDWAGRALLDDGLVIDMALMRRVDVDQARSVATLAGGATAADVVAAAEAHGLTAATGMVGEVGMVGLTLAGGYGPLNGVAGLALDNLIGAEVVLANGRDVTINAHREPDLFWALRGGGALSPRCTCGCIPSRRLPLGQAAQADAAYGRNANRLRAIKRRWDPQNVFSATPLPARLRFGCRRGA